MASNGLPYRALDRVLTSQITSTWRSAATMSISPSVHRQLRSRIRNPGPFRDGAWSSTSLPASMRLSGVLDDLEVTAKSPFALRRARRLALLAALAALHMAQRQPRSEYR